mgnify:CR=1 FL=1
MEVDLLLNDSCWLGFCEDETEAYWIPKMPPLFLKTWDTLSPLCERYYKNISKPYYLSFLPS